MDVNSPEYGNNRCEPSLTSILFWVPEGKKTKRWMIATPIKMKEIHPGTIANKGLPKSATAHQTEAQTQRRTAFFPNHPPNQTGSAWKIDDNMSLYDPI